MRASGYEAWLKQFRPQPVIARYVRSNPAFFWIASDIPRNDENKNHREAMCIILNPFPDAKKQSILRSKIF